jgi:hypothetical protein
LHGRSGVDHHDDLGTFAQAALSARKRIDRFRECSSPLPSARTHRCSCPVLHQARRQRQTICGLPRAQRCKLSLRWRLISSSL